MCGDPAKEQNREIIIDAMEHALASAVKKKYKLDNKSQDEIDVQVTINQDDGSYKTLRRWEVVNEMLVDDEYEMKMLIDLAKEKNPEMVDNINKLKNQILYNNKENEI